MEYTNYILNSVNTCEKSPTERNVIFMPTCWSCTAEQINYARYKVIENLFPEQPMYRRSPKVLAKLCKERGIKFEYIKI